MLNEQINETSAHAIITQVASYFDAVDRAVRVGDTNKRYSVTTNACTSPSAPISNKSFTNVTISPTADNMADLYNGFIYAELKVKLRVSKVHAASSALGSGATNITNYPSVWVGFKDAAQAIAQYQILANGTTIYNQPNAIKEFYITACADVDSVKKTDVFSRARHKDIWQKVDTVRTGMIVPLNNVAAGAETPEISLVMKIDIRRFLPLATVKFLPAFVGNLSLRIQFTPDALVCAPLTLEDVLGSPIKLGNATVDYPITNRFVPLGQPFRCIDKVTVAANVPTVTFHEDQVITCSSFTVSECNAIVPCFGLDDYLYQQLVQRYSTEALSFPIQTLNVQGMNTVKNGTTVNATVSVTPRFVDNIFLNFRNDADSAYTCHANPIFDSWQIKMGGYGSFPDIAVNSYGAQFYEIMCNAYNVNTDVACFNDDVMKSLTTIAPGINGGYTIPPSIGYKSNDVTNFIMSIPCSTDGTYQQGQTSATPITYQFQGRLSASSPYVDIPEVKDGGGVVTTPAKHFPMECELCTLRDSVFAIQCRGGQTPIIIIDEADITTPGSPQ